MDAHISCHFHHRGGYFWDQFNCAVLFDVLQANKMKHEK